MFTGLIQAIGTVSQCTFDPQHGLTLTVSLPPQLAQTLSQGASLAVNGCCLTVTNSTITDHVQFDVSPETLAHTTFDQLTPGQLVNLEPPMTLGAPLGGHMVSGHIDAMAQLIQVTPHGNSHIMRFRVLQPDPTMALVVEKGSVAIDGISLTINTVIQDVFSVAIIPHTWQHTHLHTLTVGDRVNLETDLIGRYVLHLMTVGRVPTLYDQQAASADPRKTVNGLGQQVRLGEWFNGAPC
jgi:riboflavin synthase